MSEFRSVLLAIGYCTAMHWSTLLMACVVAACADTRESVPAASSAGITATAGTMSKHANSANVAGIGAVRDDSLTRRKCGRPSFGADWTIDAASPGIQCRGRADCGTDPLVYCLAFADDCVEADADSCKVKSIRSTFCRYDDCASDADCTGGARCVCPEAGGDPWCVADGCDDDGDCDAGQHCRSDQAISGVGPLQHCSTSTDLCDESTVCDDPLQACGYDMSNQLWKCSPRVIVD